MLKIGIIGAGVVGGALHEWFKKNTDHKVFIDDPKIKDEISGQEALDTIFVCVPVPTLSDGTQDIRILKEVLRKHERFRNIPIYIRSTVLPKTTDSIRKQLKMRLYAMPEFLTARSAYESIEFQDIITGFTSDVTFEAEEWALLKAIFPGKNIISMSNKEAELAKYAHNCMGAIKVNFFNLIKKYADIMSCDYGNVKNGFLMSGYINAEHVDVPGPDGKYGFGGTCFPKDLKAFVKELKRLGLQHGVCELVEFENAVNRLKWHDYMNVRVPEIKLPDEFRVVTE